MFETDRAAQACDLSGILPGDEVIAEALLHEEVGKISCRASWVDSPDKESLATRIITLAVGMFDDECPDAKFVEHTADEWVKVCVYSPEPIFETVYERVRVFDAGTRQILDPIFLFTEHVLD